MKLEKFFVLICWWTIIWNYIVYGEWSSGHTWICEDDETLKCEICGKAE